jgi:hypothetical protein
MLEGKNHFGVLHLRLDFFLVFIFTYDYNMWHFLVMLFLPNIIGSTYIARADTVQGTVYTVPYRSPVQERCDKRRSYPTPHSYTQ